MLAVAVLVAGPAAAGPPDLSGFWSPPRQIHPDPALMAKLPPNTAVLQDTGAAEFPKGEYGGLKLKPATLARAQAWQPEEEMTIARTCLPPSIVYSIQGPFPFEVIQTPRLIVLRYEYFDQVRLIYMDGRKHLPPDAPHTKVGDSIGHWEGDELVIDTDHIAASTITNNGLFHSDDVHTVERYKLSPDRKRLMATQWFEDPKTLDNNGARYIEWTAKPGQYLFPYECDPAFALNYKGEKAN